MDVSRTTASCADGKLACQLSFCTGCEGSRLLVSHMYEFDSAIFGDCVSHCVEAIAGDGVNSFYSSLCKGVYKLLSYSSVFFVLFHRISLCL